MWTIEIVKARFIEAADIERRMLVKSAVGGGNGWPTYDFDNEDRKGWVQADIDAAREYWAENKITSMPEVTRWEEVFFEWTQLIPQQRRLLVWRWAQAIANGWSFSEWCQKKGIVRRTAYNRIERVFSILTARFADEARLLRQPGEKWASQLKLRDADSQVSSQDVARDAKRPQHQPFRTGSHHDALTTPEAVAAFAQHLAETNERRRKARLRKALRGVPGELAGEAEAA